MLSEMVGAFRPGSLPEVTIPCERRRSMIDEPGKLVDGKSTSGWHIFGWLGMCIDYARCVDATKENKYGFMS